MANTTTTSTMSRHCQFTGAKCAATILTTVNGLMPQLARKLSAWSSLPRSTISPNQISTTTIGLVPCSSPGGRTAESPGRLRSTSNRLAARNDDWVLQVAPGVTEVVLNLGTEVEKIVLH